PFYGTLEGTVHYLAVIGARNAADDIPGSAGGHLAGYFQVADHGAFLEGVKEPGMRVLAGKGKAADGMSVSFKSSPKGGDGQKILRLPVQGNVLVQNYGFALGPGIQATVLRQFPKVLLGLDVDGIRFIGKGQGREEKAGQQNKGKAGGNPPLFYLECIIPLHL